MVNGGARQGGVQAKVLESLAGPQAYNPPPATVERIETHASVVFLAGDFAYKVKRAVEYPFLDFSTLAKRHAACLNELRLNRRTAPQIYREVVPITEGPGGAFRLGGEGEPVEWALVMRRFAQDSLFDRMAAEGRLPLESMPPLARAIRALHEGADRVLSPDRAVARLEAIVAEHESLLRADGGAFPSGPARELAQRTREVFSALVPLLRRRAQGGSVRHCHGDLHLRNIVEIEGVPVLFDCIEFDDSLATIDVLYDLAFLLMDLGKRDLGRHANAVLNAYLDAGGTGDLLGLAALPLFLSLRAFIRAKVELLRAETAVAHDVAQIAPDVARDDAHLARDAAQSYFARARGFLAPAKPRLVAIGGLSGSGKSTVARAIADRVGAFPGAVIVRSDAERKRLFGVPQETRLPAEAYEKSVSDQVYSMCRTRAGLALAGGATVILDAVQAKRGEREEAAALARAHGAAFTGLWLEAPYDVMRARVVARSGDVSDAGPEVVAAQLGYDLGAMHFARIDARGGIDDVAARCLARIRG